MSPEQANLDTVRAFFAALQSGGGPEQVSAFYSPDVVQEEFPNGFLPNGARRGLTRRLGHARTFRSGFPIPRWQDRAAKKLRLLLSMVTVCRLVCWMSGGTEIIHVF